MTLLDAHDRPVSLAARPGETSSAALLASAICAAAAAEQKRTIAAKSLAPGTSRVVTSRSKLLPGGHNKRGRPFPFPACHTVRPAQRCLTGHHP